MSIRDSLKGLTITHALFAVRYFLAIGDPLPIPPIIRRIPPPINSSAITIADTTYQNRIHICSAHHQASHHREMSATAVLAIPSSLQAHHDHQLPTTILYIPHTISQSIPLRVLAPESVTVKLLNTRTDSSTAASSPTKSTPTLEGFGQQRSHIPKVPRREKASPTARNVVKMPTPRPSRSPTLPACRGRTINNPSFLASLRVGKN